MSSVAARAVRPARNGILRRIGSALLDVYLFVRFPALSFSLVLPLLGAGTASPDLSTRQIAGLVVVAVLFHVFAYVSNDVIDLAIDRTEPLRRESPLVREKIGPRQAAAVALAQVPLAFLVTSWLGGHAPTKTALAAAFVLMSIYNLWGKRSPFPPLTDAVQALGCVSLALVGVAAVNVRTTPATVLLSAHIFVLILMVNGIHGSLRDLANDHRCGARTTALLLGARIDGRGRLSLPPSFLLYALALQGLLVALTVAALRHLLSERLSHLSAAVVVASAGLTVLSVVLMFVAHRYRADPSRLMTVGMLHLVTSVGLLPATYGPFLGPELYAISLGACFLPWIAMWARYGSRWQIV